MKKLLISLGILLLLILLVQNEIGKKESIIKNIKSIIPENIKNNLKRTLFIFKNQKNLEKQLDDQIKLNISLEKQINELPELLGFINFKKDENVKLFKLNEKEFEIKKFKTNSINIAKNSSVKGTSYLEIFNDKIILANANGIFSYFNIENF